MQCKLSRVALKNALERVKVGLPAHRMLRPDDDHYTVLIEAGARGVFVTALGGVMRLTTRAGEAGAVSAQGACAVSYGQVYKAVSALPGKAPLHLNQQGEDLQVSGGPEPFALCCYPPEAFSALAPLRAAGETYQVEERWPTGQGSATREDTTVLAYEVLAAHTQGLAIGRDVLRDAFLSVAYAAEREDTHPLLSRPTLSGVYVHLRGDRLTLVASDAYRLARCQLALPGAGSWGHPLVIPARCLAAALELLPAGSRLSLTSQATTDRLAGENGRVIVDAEPFLNPALVWLADEQGVNLAALRLISRQYPDLERYIPTDPPTRVVCGKGALREALLAIAPVAKLSGNRTTFAVEPGAPLRLLAQDRGHARGERREVAAVATGSAVEVDLDCQYVLAALDEIASPEVALGLPGRSRPCLISPAREGGDTCQHVVMSMCWQE